MDSYIFVTLIIIILAFKLGKYSLSSSVSALTREHFSANRTEIIYSNYENESSSQLYAKINEEILVLEQVPGKDRVMKFKYLRAPLNSWITIYVRKEQENGQVTINTILYQITTDATDLINLFMKNNVFFNDNAKVIRYYIKALNETTYNIEKKASDAIKILRFRYNNCIKSKNDVSSNIAIEYCKKEFGIP